MKLTPEVRSSDIVNFYSKMILDNAKGVYRHDKKAIESSFLKVRDAFSRLERLEAKPSF